MRFLPKDFLIDLSFYLIVGFIPVVFSPLFLNWFEFPKLLIFYLLIILILSLKVLNLSSKSRLTIKISSLDILLILFLGIYFLSSVFALNPKTAFLGLYDSWVTSFITLLFLLFFYLLLSRRLIKDQWRLNFLIFLTFGATLVAAYALYQYFSISKGLSFSKIIRVGSTLGQPIYLGFYLSLVLPFSLFLFLKSKKTINRLIFFLCFLLISVGLLITFSRGVWLAILISSSLVFLAWLVKIFKNKKKKPIRLSLKTLGPLTLLLILLVIFNRPITSRIRSTFSASPEQNTAKIRLAEWKGVWKVFKTRPLLGVGPENLYYLYGKFRDPWLNSIENEWYFKLYNARNLYLDLLAKTGTLGFLSFFLVISWALFNLIKTFFASKRGSRNEALSLTVLGSLVIFLIVSFYSLQIIYSQILFFILLSFVWSLTQKKALVKKIQINLNDYPKMRKLPSVQKIFAILLFVFGVFFLAKFALADNLVSSSLKKTGPSSCDLASKGLSLNPLYSVYYRLLADCYFNLSGETYLEGVAKVDISPKNQIWAQRALETIEKAIFTDSHDPVNYANFARFYFRLSKLDPSYVKKSIWAAKKRLEYESSWPTGWDSLGQGYLDLGELEKAKESFEKALSLKKNYPPAHFHLGETLRQMGNPEEALPHYQLFQGPRAEQEILETLKGIKLKNQ